MPVTSTDHPPCPVCDGACASLGAVDFNKNCEEANGRYLPPSGRPVSYVACTACGFAFAPEFAAWTPEMTGATQSAVAEAE